MKFVVYVESYVKPKRFSVATLLVLILIIVQDAKRSISIKNFFKNILIQVQTKNVDKNFSNCNFPILIRIWKRIKVKIPNNHWFLNFIRLNRNSNPIKTLKKINQKLGFHFNFRQRNHINKIIIKANQSKTNIDKHLMIILKIQILIGVIWNLTHLDNFRIVFIQIHLSNQIYKTKIF